MALELILYGLICLTIFYLFSTRRILKNVATNINLISFDKCDHAWEVVTNDRIETDKEVRLLIVQKCTECGKLDKVVETIEKECNHKWEPIDEVVESSPMANANWHFLESKEAKHTMSEKWFHKSSRVAIMACDKCGAIDKTEVTNVEIKK